MTSTDEHYMHLALQEAEKAAARDDFPVGAIVVLDGKIISRGTNSCRTTDTWNNHAETEALHAASKSIRRHAKDRDLHATLYTTLEPCLMCLGAAVLHRIERIVYACPDPNGGVSMLSPKALPVWYAKHWPDIEQGMYCEESYQLLVPFMRRHLGGWEKILNQFEEMHRTW